VPLLARYWRRLFIRHAFLAPAVSLTAVVGVLLSDGILVFRLGIRTACAAQRS